MALDRLATKWGGVLKNLQVSIVTHVGAVTCCYVRVRGTIKRSHVRHGALNLVLSVHWISDKIWCGNRLGQCVRVARSKCDLPRYCRVNQPNQGHAGAAALDRRLA